MAKGTVWKTDWFLGVVISVLFLLSGQSDLIQSLERKAYDVGVAATSRTPSPRIAIIAIDQQSIDSNSPPWAPAPVGSSNNGDSPTQIP